MELPRQTNKNVVPQRSLTNKSTKGRSPSVNSLSSIQMNLILLITRIIRNWITSKTRLTERLAASGTSLLSKLPFSNHSWQLYCRMKTKTQTVVSRFLRLTLRRITNRGRLKWNFHYKTFRKMSQRSRPKYKRKRNSMR